MKNTKVLLQQLEQDQHMETFQKIYIDDSMLEMQKHRYMGAIKQYESIFGEGEVEIYSAPGRTEIGGNHTDHQRGMVLAGAINLDAIAVVGTNELDIIRIESAGYGMVEVNLKDLSYKKEEEGTTKALIKGVVAKLIEEGCKVDGFQAYVTSNVLSGSGLSSSAAFETLIGTIVSGMYCDQSISPVRIAQISQYAENHYFGKPSGLMDQMACSVGGIIHIDFKEAEHPVIKTVDLDMEREGYSLCIVDTKGSHEDMTNEYAAIPQEMSAVAAYFQKSYLSEVNEAEFYKHIREIRKEVGDRCVLRAIHFFLDNRRVKQEITALQRGTFSEFLQLVKESGNSSYKYLQNVYSSQDVQNQNVSIALAVSEQVLKDHGVCRVHGGGFAGTIQAFVRNDYANEYKKEMENLFGTDACIVLKIRNYGGMKVL